MLLPELFESKTIKLSLLFTGVAVVGDGVRIVVRKSDDLFWTYKAGDEISVTYGRADDQEDSIYNYKITSLLSSGNEYKGVEQTKTLNWN